MTASPLRLGVHLGQQNASMAELTALWTRLDDVVDWISLWDHLYEAPPAGGTTPHIGATTEIADAELRKIDEQWGPQAGRITSGALT